MPSVSVVIATHNRADRLPALIGALSEQTLQDFDVTIVDDGSRDDTPAVLARLTTGSELTVHVLRHEPAQGAGAARNRGWAATTAPVVAFTDDDCLPSPRWLQAGLEALAGDENRIVQGRTTPTPADERRIGPFSRTLRVTRLGPNYQTANMFYPRALLERHGGFDTEAFPSYGAEDADLAWRCLAAGAEARWAPDAQVFHAVHQLGPLGRLRAAWRWSEVVNLYARHPEGRKYLTYRLFWKKTHYLIVRAALGLLVPKRLRWARFWFYAPLAPAYLQRARHEGGPPYLAPYFILHDAVETAAILRGAVRYRTPVV